MNKLLRFLLIVGLLLGAGALFAQEDFSAEMVDTAQGKPVNKAKIYATKDKMRFEPEAEGPHKAAVIINLSTHTSDALMPDRKMYMEFTQGQEPGMQKWNRDLFRPSDVDNACSEWVKLPQNQGGSCKKVGSETVNGRKTVKYEGTNAKGETGYAWLDPKIGFPIKWQSDANNEQWELQNIKEGAQPASLFEIPSDYQKFQMPAGMPNMQRPR